MDTIIIKKQEFREIDDFQNHAAKCHNTAQHIYFLIHEIASVHPCPKFKFAYSKSKEERIQQLNNLYAKIRGICQYNITFNEYELVISLIEMYKAFLNPRIISETHLIKTNQIFFQTPVLSHFNL